MVGLLVMLGFGLLAALGDRTPFGRLVYAIVPMSGAFRAWARDLLLVDVAVACLAVLGMREVSALPRVWISRLAIGTVAVALVIRFIPLVTDLGGAIPDGGAGAAAVGIPIVLLLATLGAIALVPVRRQAGIVLLIVVCAIDMVTFTLSSPWRVADGRDPALARSYYGDGPPMFGLPADAPGGVDRWVSDTYVFRMVSAVKDIQGINGYDPLLQTDFAETAGGFVYDGYPRRGDMWGAGWLPDVLRVTTLVAAPSVQPDASWQRDGEVPGTQFVRWTRVPRLDEAYLVGDVRFESLDTVRERLRSDDTDLLETVYVDTDQPDPHPDVFAGRTTPGPAGTVPEMSMDGGGSGRYVVDAERPAVLVVSYGWLDGWQATVDGKDVPLVRANGLVLGVPVPAGHHEVRFRFVPPGLRLGLLLAGLACVSILTPWAIGRWRRRRRSVPERHDGLGYELDGDA